MLLFGVYVGVILQHWFRVGIHVRCNDVMWRAAPAKFIRGMCEMNIFGFEICSVSWDVGSGWVGTNAWCNMESCSGKVQKSDV